MTFRISLNKASKAAQLGSKAKAEEDAKRREEKNALDRVMADFMEEHGEEKNILGEPDKDHEVEDNVFVPTGSKRHFTGRPRSMKTGPGTLENEAPLGPSFSRPGVPGGFPGPSNRHFGAPAGGTAAQDKASENVYTTVVALASNLPPAMTPARVEELFAEFPSLKVVKVEKIAPSRPNSPSQGTRPSASMKVTFDKEANARHLDAAMNKLNDKKYLGKGYYLHLDRYLGGRSVSTKKHEEPFGATLQNVEVAKGYAPPPDLGGNNRDRARDDMANKRMVVTVNPPPDLPTLRLIHQTVEGVIQGGMEFEAALMEVEKIQNEERFAWLFDQKHPNNRYYRWRLYQMLSSTGDPEVFEGQPEWRGPPPIQDEFATSPWDLKDPVSDPDSEDEDELPAHARSILPPGDDYPGRVSTGYGILPYRSRCFLMYLLSSIPPSAALYDEVAAVSNFAVEHVTKGMDEIVTHLVSNVFTPFHLTPANLKYVPKADAGEEEDRRRAQTPHLVCNAMKIISDVTLTTQKELGSAYKYRGVIGAQLGDRKVFEYLERLPTSLDMGKLAKNLFREEINNILRVWTEEHTFEKGILERFDNAFNGPTREKEQEEAERKAEEKRKAKKGTVPVPVPKKREVEIKAKDGGAAEAAVVNNQQEESTPMDIDEAPVAPAIEAPPTSADAMVAESSKSTDPPEIPGETAAARARRLRPKAEDMFASDDED